MKDLGRQSHEQGFTLVELLVVIGIIAILTAIAVPMFLSQRQKAVDTSLLSDVRTMTTSIHTRMIDIPNSFWYGTASADGGLTLKVGTSITEQGDAEFIPMSEGTHMRVEPDGVGKGFSIYAYNPNGKRYNSPATTLTYHSLNGGMMDDTTVKTGASFGIVG